jgi:hypothetical protein
LQLFDLLLLVFDLLLLVFDLLMGLIQFSLADELDGFRLPSTSLLAPATVIHHTVTGAEGFVQRMLADPYFTGLPMRLKNTMGFQLRPRDARS